MFDFHRTKHNGMLITSQTYTRSEKTCSSYVRYLNNGQETYGQVKTFVELSECACPGLCDCPRTFLAFITEFTSQFGFTTANPPFSIQYIKKVNASETVHCVPIKDILNVCFYVNLDGQEYLCDPLNTVEMYN